MARKQIATFLGPNLGLSIIGEHCYGYSGPFARSTSQQIMLSFKTGNYYAITELTCFGSVNPASGTVGGGETSGFTVKINGNEVMIIKTDTAPEDSPHQYSMPFLIPPHSNITIEVVSSGSGDAGNTECTIVGRIYNA